VISGVAFQLEKMSGVVYLFIRRTLEPTSGISNITFQEVAH